jgi:hypothetical protein
MIEVKFEPKTNGFTGHVMVLVPNYFEKIDMMKELAKSGIKMSDFERFQTMETDEKFSVLSALSPIIPTLIKSVDLKYGEIEVKDVNILLHANEGLEVLFEVFGLAMEGYSLQGKK